MDALGSKKSKLAFYRWEGMVKFRSSLSMNAKYDFYVQWYKIIANGVCLGFFLGGGGGGGQNG